MTIKNFKRGPAKSSTRKLDYMNKLIDEIDTSDDTPRTLADEAMARALDNVFPPRKTASEGWQYTVRMVALCACIGFVFWCMSK